MYLFKIEENASQSDLQAGAGIIAISTLNCSFSSSIIKNVLHMFYCSVRIRYLSTAALSAMTGRFLERALEFVVEWNLSQFLVKDC